MCTRPSPQLWEAGPGDEARCDNYYPITERVFFWLLVERKLCTNMEEQVLARVSVEEENGQR